MVEATKTRAPRLGKLLVYKGLITGDQLAAALRVQAQTGERLGGLLVKQGAISEQQLHYCLRWQGLLQAASLVAGLSACGAPLGYCDNAQAGNGGGAEAYQASATTAESKKFSWSMPSRYLFTPEQRQITYQLVEKTRVRMVHFAQVNVKNSLVGVLRGQYAAGVESYEYGARFQADWSNRHIRLKLSYQF